MDRWEIRPASGRNPVPKRLMTRAKIPQRYWGASLDFLPDNAAKKGLTDYLENLQDALLFCRGLYIHGPYGSGKTAAACIVLRDVLARSANRAVFVTTAQIDWIARHRDHSGGDGDYSWWELLCNGPFAVIDDVAAERKTDWNSAWFEEVVRARYHNFVPTVFTSNIHPTELSKQVEWFAGILRDSATTLELTEVFR